MPVPNRDDIRQRVREGFNARHQPLPPPPGDETIVSVALGLLRQLANPSGGTLAELATQAFRVLPVDAAGAEGRRLVPGWPT